MKSLNPDRTAPTAGPSSPSRLPVPAPAAPSRPGLGRFWWVALVVVGAGLLAGLAPRWHQRALLREESADQGALYVTVVRPHANTNASALVLPGEVQPFVEAPIYARVSGYLKRWYFDIGHSVKQGEVLAEIDAPELDQQLGQARADLNRAEASLELARSTSARWQELLKTASVSEQEAAEKSAGLATASATVEAARANVRRLEELQSFERVVAPFAGVVTERATDLGQLINAGAGHELFRLAQTRILRVYVHVPQAASPSIAPGQAADLFFAEQPDRVFPAQVVRTAGAIDPQSRTLLTELQVDNERGEILAGAYAQVRFRSTADPASLVLPANTLIFRAEGTQVGVVGADQRAQLRKVALGRDFGTSVEVLTGVTSNDLVILNPSDSLASGDSVQVGKAEGADNNAFK